MRRKALTPSQIEDLVRLAESGAKRTEQAAHFGMCRDTLTKRIKEQPEVFRALADVGARLRASFRPSEHLTKSMADPLDHASANAVHLAWLVGLLEGEGCFRWSSMSSGRAERGPHAQGADREIQWRPYHGSAEVVLVMTDEDVVRRAARVAAHWGVTAPNVSVRNPKNPNWKRAWVAKWTGRRAIMLLILIEPFMGARRRARIKEILTALSTEPSDRVGRDEVVA